MSLANLVEAFEEACRDAQVASTRPAAEEALKSFFSYPGVVSLAVAVIEKTNSPLARFHAAAALHSTARDRWASLRPSQRFGQDSLRYWIINKVISIPSLTTFERRALLRTAAFLSKRAYLEESRQEKDAFFLSLEKTAISQASVQHIATAVVELIDLVVEDFLVPSLPCSSSAVERELVIRTRNEFAAPGGDVVRLLTLAKDTMWALLSSAQNGLSAEDWEARVVPALSAITKIITTDPKLQEVLTKENSSAMESDTAGSDIGSLEAVVNNRFASPEWVSLINQIPELIRICFSVISLHLKTGEPESESQVLLRGMQAIIAISAISQASYPKANVRGVLTALFVGMTEQRWSSCHIDVVRLGYAEVWKRISSAFGLAYIESLPQNWISNFSKDTCLELDTTATRLSSPKSDGDVFSLDVVDILLETWGHLTLQGCDGSMADHRLSSYIENVITHFLHTFLRSSGKPAEVLACAERLDSEEDLGYEDTSIDDSRFSVAAGLTRFVLDRVAGKVAQSLLNVAQKVFSWNSGNSPPLNALSVFQEDLFFLIHFTSAVLADEAKGEVPSLPSQYVQVQPGSEIKECTTQGIQVKLLLHAFMEVAQGESYAIQKKGVHGDESSPRIGTAVLDGLSKICRTYLVPDDVSSVSIAAQLVGGHQYLESSLNVCFQKSAEGLLQRGFETDVAESASVLLFHLAAAARSFQNVRGSHYWRTFTRQGVEFFQTLPIKAVREIGRSFTYVVGDDEMADTFLRPASDALLGFAGAESNLADAAERVIAVVNLLGGAARSERLGSRTRAHLLQTLETPGGVAPSCARAFSRNRPDVSRSLVNLADSITCSSLSVLSNDEARILITNAVNLIALHAEIMGGQKSSLSVDELASDTVEMLALLTHILEESVDFDASEPCYYGLSAMLPVMSNALLELPRVSMLFFGFVTQLVRRYPSKLSSVPPELRRQILHTIDLQRRSSELVAERHGLDAIRALGWSWGSDMTEGSGKEAIGQALRGFASSIFNGITTGLAHTSNLEAAADAFLPLLHVKVSQSASVVEELGQALLTSAGHNSQIRNALEDLLRVGSRARSMYGYDAPHATVANQRALQVEATKSFREAFTLFSLRTKNALVSLALRRG